jgi:hypothetical protein
MRGHTGAVTLVAFNPGQKIVSASAGRDDGQASSALTIPAAMSLSAHRAVFVYF